MKLSARRAAEISRLILENAVKRRKRTRSWEFY
jgi:hypothetical protein